MSNINFNAYQKAKEKKWDLLEGVRTGLEEMSHDNNPEIK
jgi:hypothetical protein